LEGLLGDAGLVVLGGDFLWDGEFYGQREAAGPEACCAQAHGGFVQQLVSDGPGAFDCSKFWS
jgi:hypothetical protein